MTDLFTTDMLAEQRCLNSHMGLEKSFAATTSWAEPSVLGELIWDEKKGECIGRPG